MLAEFEKYAAIEVHHARIVNAPKYSARYRRVLKDQSDEENCILHSTSFRSISQGKIDQLDQRLGQVDRLVEALLGKEQTDRMTGDVESPKASLPSHFTSSPNQAEPPANVNVPEGLTALPLRSECHKSRQAGRDPKAKSSKQEEGHAPEEGPSSLSAHSSFAIDFLHHFASSDGDSGLGIETQGLLESLRQIVNALKDQPLSPALLFPMAKSGVSEGHEPGHMPPIQAAVEIIQKAQGSFCFGWNVNHRLAVQPTIMLF
nr:fungal specific transcription factor domain-containing protein [Colletotrichum truncatum]KAF6784792.1 fungal specific transcription factor domain-containing protein [Colletotrichum truncatum]